MFFLFPLSIETLERYRPWINWVIIGLTVILYYWSGVPMNKLKPAAEGMILTGSNVTVSGLFGYMFLHASFMHLLGNMVFLWVFGNVICQTTGNLLYPLIYLGTGICAGLAHLMFSDAGVIGASGAVSGVTGVALALFPLNRVNVAYLFFTKGGTFEIRVLSLCIISVLWDFAGATMGFSGVAHWAHIGGLVSGVVLGLVCLHFRWIVLSCFDNKSLYEMITGRELERSDDEVDNELEESSPEDRWS